MHPYWYNAPAGAHHHWRASVLSLHKMAIHAFNSLCFGPRKRRVDVLDRVDQSVVKRQCTQDPLSSLRVVNVPGAPVPLPAAGSRLFALQATCSTGYAPSRGFATLPHPSASAALALAAPAPPQTPRFVWPLSAASAAGTAAPAVAPAATPAPSASALPRPQLTRLFEPLVKFGNRVMTSIKLDHARAEEARARERRAHAEQEAERKRHALAKRVARSKQVVAAVDANASELDGFHRACDGLALSASSFEEARTDGAAEAAELRSAAAALAAALEAPLEPKQAQQHKAQLGALSTRATALMTALATEVAEAAAAAARATADGARVAAAFWAVSDEEAQHMADVDRPGEAARIGVLLVESAKLPAALEAVRAALVGVQAEAQAAAEALEAVRPALDALCVDLVPKPPGERQYTLPPLSTRPKRPLEAPRSLSKPLEASRSPSKPLASAPCYATAPGPPFSHRLLAVRPPHTYALAVRPSHAPLTPARSRPLSVRSDGRGGAGRRGARPRPRR